MCENSWVDFPALESVLEFSHPPNWEPSDGPSDQKDITEEWMYGGCPICKPLWDEYFQATKDYLAVVSKFKLAQIEQNIASLKELELVRVAAAERRGKARMAYRDHEANHQDEGAKSQTS
jgi:hypothetical protein